MRSACQKAGWIVSRLISVSSTAGRSAFGNPTGRRLTRLAEHSYAWRLPANRTPINYSTCWLRQSAIPMTLIQLEPTPDLTGSPDSVPWVRKRRPRNEHLGIHGMPWQFRRGGRTYGYGDYRYRFAPDGNRHCRSQTTNRRNLGMYSKGRSISAAARNGRQLRDGAHLGQEGDWGSDSVEHLVPAAVVMVSALYTQG